MLFHKPGPAGERPGSRPRASAHLTTGAGRGPASSPRGTGGLTPAWTTVGTGGMALRVPRGRARTSQQTGSHLPPGSAHIQASRPRPRPVPPPPLTSRTPAPPTFSPPGPAHIQSPRPLPRLVPPAPPTSRPPGPAHVQSPWPLPRPGPPAPSTSSPPGPAHTPAHLGGHSLSRHPPQAESLRCKGLRRAVTLVAESLVKSRSLQRCLRERRGGGRGPRSHPPLRHPPGDRALPRATGWALGGR